jgi:hypothetical protein
MRYLLLIGRDDKSAPPPGPDLGVVQVHIRVSKELSDAGKMVVSERLRPETEGTRLRSKAGHVQVTDGPFAETKEALGGFYVIDCTTKDEAVERAKKLPLPDGSFIEVRPIWPM